MKILLPFLLLGLTWTAAAQDTNLKTDKRLEGLDTAFSRVLSNWKGPGFAVAVVEKNKIIYIRGFGYRNKEEKLPVTPNTLFAIGSCTKAFTASLIGELTTTDQVDIDKPIRDYLPELKFYNDDMNDRITLRDMMCHRTGLPRHDYSWYLFTTASRDSLIKRMQWLEPNVKVRDKWQYNNFMYMVQGYLVEKLTHQSWESNISNRIFQPLGMYHSNTSIAELEKNPDAAWGYEMKDSAKTDRPKKVDYYPINAMGPAGSINSCVSDMSNWLITWIYGGKFKGKEIIPASFVREAISSQMIMGSGLPEAETKDVQFSTYGFAWGLSSYRGHYRVEHGGNIDGFSASTCFFPSDSVGIVVLTNQGASSIPSIVRNLITDKIFGLKYFDWNSYLWNSYDKMKKSQTEAEDSKVKPEKPKRVVSHDLKAYAGLYNNKGYGNMEFYMEHDSMFVLIGNKMAFARQDQYDWFNIYERSKDGKTDTSRGFGLEFRTNQAGDVYALEAQLEPMVKPLIFNKIPKAAAIITDSLRKFEGDYVIASMQLKVFLQNHSLRLSVPGQPEYELVPLAANKFALKNMTGFTITFDSNEKNEVTGLTSVQPNGTFKALKKLKD